MTYKNVNYFIGLFLGMVLAGPFIRAQQPLDLEFPSSSLAFFDRNTAGGSAPAGCDVGWTEVTGARGFFLTNMVSGGTRATAVGTAYTNQEARTHTHTMSHTHTITHTHTWSFTTGAASANMPKRALAIATVSTAAHTHTGSGTTGGSSAANTGAESAGTGTQSVTQILPYLQYLVCKKN